MSDPEEWRPIAGFHYEVSDRGRVRNTRKLRRQHGGILRQSKDSNGYWKVKLGAATRGVHRLVCEAWHGPPPTPDVQIRHLDGTRTNNTPANLRWDARSNADDRRIHGTHPSGERHGHEKLKQWQADELRRLYAIDMTERRSKGFVYAKRGYVAILQRAYGSTHSIYRILLGKSYVGLDHVDTYEAVSIAEV